MGMSNGCAYLRTKGKVAENRDYFVCQRRRANRTTNDDVHSLLRVANHFIVEWKELE